MARIAINSIIVSRAVHLDQLTDKLKEDRVRRVILPIILTKEAVFDSHDREYCIDLGLIKKSDRGFVIANKIYSEVIPREISDNRQQYFLTKYRPDWINSNGSLNTPMLFEMFTDFWRTNSEIWAESMSGYEEAAPHLVFQAFLQRVANGDGYVRREYALGTGRTDIYLEWQGHKNADNYDASIKPQRIVVELKMLRTKDGLDTIKAKALEQTAQYSKRCNATENYILIFDRDRKTDWREKVFTETVQYDGMKFAIWGV